LASPGLHKVLHSVIPDLIRGPATLALEQFGRW